MSSSNFEPPNASADERRYSVSSTGSVDENKPGVNTRQDAGYSSRPESRTEPVMKKIVEDENTKKEIPVKSVPDVLSATKKEDKTAINETMKPSPIPQAVNNKQEQQQNIVNGGQSNDQKLNEQNKNNQQFVATNNQRNEEQQILSNKQQQQQQNVAANNQKNEQKHDLQTKQEQHQATNNLKNQHVDTNPKNVEERQKTPTKRVQPKLDAQVNNNPKNVEEKPKTPTKRVEPKQDTQAVNNTKNVDERQKTPTKRAEQKHVEQRRKSPEAKLENKKIVNGRISSAKGRKTPDLKIPLKSRSAKAGYLMLRFVDLLKQMVM